MKKIEYAIVCFFLFINVATAQQITYSDPERDDINGMNFEIIGKLNGNFLVYKTIRDVHTISVLDAQLQPLEKFKLDYLHYKTFAVDFVVYNNYAFLIYQYQQKNLLFCKAVKLDALGKKVGNIIDIDSTNITEDASNKIYSIVQSANKQKTVIYKVNNQNDKAHQITTLLFNNNLELINKQNTTIALQNKNSFLTSFELDNLGNFVFIKATGSPQNDNIKDLVLYHQNINNDTTIALALQKIDNVFCSEVKIKADNVNNKFAITALYTKQRRGNIQGIYISLFDTKNDKEQLSTTTIFDADFRNDAKTDNSPKSAFDDYFIKDIIFTSDGSFLVVSEAAYSRTKDNNNLARWDYANNYPSYSANSFYANNSFRSSYPWSSNNSNYNITRYYAENIAIIKLDTTGKQQWSNVVIKSQFDDNSDSFVGFGTINTSGQLHFAFNVLERGNQFLTDQSIDAEGQITRLPTLKNLDRGYVFMPRHLKQVGSKQIIVPCMLRNSLCFAKIDF
jgi:hypothetical protein